MLIKLRKAELWKNRAYYLMALPAIILFFLFAYLPMPGIIIAFKDYNFVDGIFGSPWAGLKNFQFFFKSIYAGRTTFNTIWINLNNLVWGTTVAVAFAIMLNEIRHRTLKRVYQNVMFLPFFLSAIVVGKFVSMMFSDKLGLVNQFLDLIGASSIPWYSSPEYWVKIIVGTNIWKGTGYSVIVYLATITGIDDELYTAAQLDGASRLQCIRYITLPLLVPTVIILTLLAIGRMVYGDFGTIYAMVGDTGKLMPTTDIIETYVFRAVRTSAEFSTAAAVGLYQSVVGFILVAGSNLAVRLYNKDYSLF